MSGAALLRADAVRIPLADGSVHLSISSPPYFALRSYQDGGEHFGGQIGSEPTPADFLRALWAVADEVYRVLDVGGSAWWNLGDKYAGSGGHNNATLSKKTAGGTKAGRVSRRDGWDRYNQAADVRSKSLMGLPWRFMMGLICPDQYRAPFEPATCWHDDGPGPCRTCPPRRFPQWIGRAEEIWSKPNGLPESVTDRPRRSHEQWFMVTKQPRYFAAVDEVREAVSQPERISAAPEGGGQRRAGKANNGFGLEGVRDRQYNPLGKLPGSVRSVPSEPLRVPEFFVSDDGEHWRAFAPPASGKAQREVRRRLWELAVERAAAGLALHVSTVDHFAAFPSEWPRWIIAGWSPSGICTACGEGRRPVRGVDWSKVPHRMERKRVLTGAESAAWCASFSDWCDAQGISRADLDAAAGTSDMGGWWASRLAHRAQVPTPEQWAKLAAVFGPLPDELGEVVHTTKLVPVALFEVGTGPDHAGRHRNSEPATRPSGYVSITGYACACPDTSAPTRPAVVLDPFAGTGTVPMMARAMGRYGVGVDLSRDYLRLANWRVFESGHGEKRLAKVEAERNPKPKRNGRKPAAVPEAPPEELAEERRVQLVERLRQLRAEAAAPLS